MLGHKWSSYIWRGRKERGPLRNVTVQDGAYLSTIAQKVMAVIIRRGRGGGINYKQQEHWPRCVGTCARIYIYTYPSITRIYLSYYFFFFSYSFEQYSKVISFPTNLSIKFHDSSKLLSQRNRTNWIFGKRIYKSIVFHLNVSSCIPETFDTCTILIIESHCKKKKKKRRKRIITFVYPNYSRLMIALTSHLPFLRFLHNNGSRLFPRVGAAEEAFPPVSSSYDRP